jgi:hypothetical protein
MKERMSGDVQSTMEEWTWGRKRGGEEGIGVYAAGARHYSHSFRSIETTSVVKERHTIDDGWMLLNSTIFCYASSIQYVDREKNPNFIFTKLIN